LRRIALAVVLVVSVPAPLAVEAQQQTNVPRIGWLGGPSRETAQAFVPPFLQGLKELGWQ